MITANDLKNMDWFLKEQQRVINQPSENKKLLKSLREKIAEVLVKISINLK